MTTIEIRMTAGLEMLRDRGSYPLPADHREWGGFTEQTVDFEDLLTHAPSFKLLRLQNVDLTVRQLAHLVRAPVFVGVQYLDIARNFRLIDRELGRLIASGAMAHLRFVSIDSCYSLGNATLEAIGGGALPNLEGLAFGSTEVSDDGLLQLANRRSLPALRALDGRFLGSLTAAGVADLHAARPELDLRIDV